ncbi:hypothetical protein PSSU_0883 [Pseudoscardovia suis]|uniref:Uncharacterized protein n=1 Tax=Pseudoscardovia suis TaxID=987063 RepID=A0A261EYD8_9BIFI|nr:hypothetical protein PSSU_0883 [Pseudoscardovia suis]
MKHTGKGHRTKTGTGSSPPAPTHKRRRPRPTGNQMTCKVAQNTLLSSQTTTTHEARRPDPAGRRPSKQQEKNIHHPPQKHKPPTNPHPQNPTNKPPPTACRTHPQTHHTTTQNNPQTHPQTPKTPQQKQKPACRVLRPRGLRLNRPPYRSTRFPTGVSPVPRNLLTRNKAASLAPCLRPACPMRRPRRHVQR